MQVEIGRLKDRLHVFDYAAYLKHNPETGEAWVESVGGTIPVNEDDPMHPDHPLFDRSGYVQ